MDGNAKTTWSGPAVGVSGAIAAWVALTVVVATGWGGEDTTVAVADVTAAIAALGGGVAAAARARRSAPRERRAWRFLATAMLLWGLGEVLWTYYEVVRGVEVPFPSIADVAYLGAVPFAIAGLLFFTTRGSNHFHLRAILDGLLVGGSFLFVGWALAVGPTFHYGADHLLAHVVSLAYPVSDVVMAAMAVLVLCWGAAEAQRSLRLVAVGFMVMAVADTAFTWMLNNGTYTSSNPVTMLWPLAYLLVGVAATSRTRPAREHDRVQSTFSLLLPYVPLFLALLVAVPRVLGGRELGAFLTANGIVLVVAVLVRQAMTAWELRDTVTALHQREEELARLALEDPLTGLANRARFSRHLEGIVSSAERPPAVVYIDLDGFKAVNDRYGHAMGDQLLKEVGARLTACCTGSMLLARLGGDEFVVLVEEGADVALDLARRVLECFTPPFHREGERISFQASVGVATAPIDGGPEEAVRRADAAMYVAKATGKGRAIGYPDELLLAASSSGL